MDLQEFPSLFQIIRPWRCCVHPQESVVLLLAFLWTSTASFCFSGFVRWNFCVYCPDLKIGLFSGFPFVSHKDTCSHIDHRMHEHFSSSIKGSPYSPAVVWFSSTTLALDMLAIFSNLYNIVFVFLLQCYYIHLDFVMLLFFFFFVSPSFPCLLNCPPSINSV